MSKGKSFVIVNKETNRAVFETYNKKLADAVCRDKYKVLPIYEYLTGFNKEQNND